MYKLMEVLRNDQELQKMRKEWKERTSCPFPPYNYDEYGGIEDYKNKIRERLKN